MYYIITPQMYDMISSAVKRYLRPETKTIDVESLAKEMEQYTRENTPFDPWMSYNQVYKSIMDCRDAFYSFVTPQMREMIFEALEQGDPEDPDFHSWDRKDTISQGIVSRDDLIIGFIWEEIAANTIQIPIVRK